MPVCSGICNQTPEFDENRVNIPKDQTEPQIRYAWVHSQGQHFLGCRVRGYEFFGDI